MSSIFGCVVSARGDSREKGGAHILDELFRASESRAAASAGVAIATPQAMLIHREIAAPSRFIHGKTYRRMSDEHRREVAAGGYVAAIGQTRASLDDEGGVEEKAQPVARDGIVLVHNGFIVNEDELWAADRGLERRTQANCEILAALIGAGVERGAPLTRALSDAFAEVTGDSSIALFEKGSNRLVLATNNGALYVATAPGFLAFASDRVLLEKALSASRLNPRSVDVKTERLDARTGMTVLLGDIARRSVFGFGGDGVAAPAVEPELQIQRRFEDTALKASQARANMIRCSRCLLPETMPFIAFDADGVCNYCHAHRPAAVLGSDELEKVLTPYRSKDKSADCVVAFSGGRDSSYGLHLLKKQYGMTPIAYTYDWGMVTDLGRRNQARVCGTLGVEHIWVSADIKAKRKNIRKNVEAWLRKPDLGMIPLFMAGDKQFFWYANQTMKQTGIKLMVFCQNKLEKTDFKTGFCGVAPIHSQDKPFTLGSMQKVKLATYYARQYATNPAYINQSILDSMWAFASYYLIKQDYVYLFDYIKWDEDDINDSLINDYDWELAKDTSTTWRIGDGTAPFYNYIYHTVAGFTEFDTFRSNQIREGVLTRDKAFALVTDENQPRWPSIREYLNMINVDFGEAMTSVHGIPRLYYPD